MKERIAELVNTIGMSLDAPYYATKILTECRKDMLQIVEDLENEIEMLKTNVAEIDKIAAKHSMSQADGYSQILWLCAAMNTEYTEE